MSRLRFGWLLGLGVISFLLVRVVHALRGEPTAPLQRPLDAPDRFGTDGVAASSQKERSCTAPGSDDHRVVIDLTDAAVWVDPVDGDCPDGFPVKAKLTSGIYHLPGMAAYGRTHPDRCYPTAEAAGGDGLRPAKR